jgi:hypothetical protein
VIRRSNMRHHSQKVKEVRLIDKAFATVISGGAATVGRYSQDLVRKLKHARGLRDCEAAEETALPSVQGLAGIEDEDGLTDPFSLLVGLV